ncbi:polysaccharide deacetylase family protein [Streptomyces chiangmaiensis]|uniref:Polysaccharide deacetylase family protein n=1 Tax=Streptomyces chiangmaiensis TaxID=766497 RepID=A0ABU7FJT0_9ACTN|nr:polysaccharide deacetylase family protein [Streptomyces chiangmaiensis]MED7824372.1 polysaccharide deacetylase family protein [Streptomyces chiangmaiensis]
MRARPWPRVLLAGTLAAVLLSGCAQSVDPIERLGKKAAQKVHRPHGGSQRTYRRWGLRAPLAPAPRPARPAGGSGRAGGGLPPVLDRVPTHDKVVFLTYDEDVENDPRFVDMVRELRLPVSVFLTDSAAGRDDARVARLRAAGAAIQNHTLGHFTLRGRPYGEQRAEICGQRDRLKARLGLRPRLLRPPYGTYDRTTLRAAADCGVTAVVLWRPAPEPHGTGAPLQPGDIVRPHEAGRPPTSLSAETTRLLRRIQARGFTVARLEDYL